MKGVLDELQRRQENVIEKLDEYEKLVKEVRDKAGAGAKDAREGGGKEGSKGGADPAPQHLVLRYALCGHSAIHGAAAGVFLPSLLRRRPPPGGLALLSLSLRQRAAAAAWPRRR